MSTSNQQTLTDSEANERPPMLEKGNYIPWESRFKRFLDNKLEEGDQTWRSIKKGPYDRPMIPNPDKPIEQILEPLSKMTEGNKKQYIADDMWERIKRLMFGSDVTNHVRHSRLMDEFDKFVAKEGESLESVYERLTTLMNIIDCNNVRPIPVAINTKFLNCLQPEWSKYVTMIRHNQTGDVVSYDELYDSLVQFEPHVQASKAKKAAKNHDTLALLAHSNASSNAERQNMNQAFNTRTGNDESNQIVQRRYARDCQKPRVRDAKCFREQMLLVMKDEAGSNLKDEENGFMLDNSYRDKTLEELTTAAVSEVNASTRVHEQVKCVQRKIIIHTSDDDQIDSNIIFDDPYVENNGGTSKHDSTAHDEYHDIKMLAHNVQREAKNQK
ncbi:hypothetical protein Tco_0617861 [Tanacetum coccineum]